MSGIRRHNPHIALCASVKIQGWFVNEVLGRKNHFPVLNIMMMISISLAKQSPGPRNIMLDRIHIQQQSLFHLQPAGVASLTSVPLSVPIGDVLEGQVLENIIFQLLIEALDRCRLQGYLKLCTALGPSTAS